MNCTRAIYSIWARAIIEPAARRAAAVWIGAGIVAAVVFGPTGMHPHDLTELAWRVPGAGAALVAIWLVLFVPTARVIVRAEGATFLRSLPHSRAAVGAMAIGALVAFQLPWLLLWLAGDGVRGLAVVAAGTLVIAALAAVRLPVRSVRTPAWRHGFTALAGVYVRGLLRRGGDALVRGAGLAVLAGIAGGLIVRNNGLAGAHAASLGTAVIAVVLVPAWVGAILPLATAYRSSGWLAASLGVARLPALAAIVMAVLLAASAIAVGAAVIAFGLPAATLGWLAATTLGTAVGTALLVTRLIAREEESAQLAARVVIGAIIVVASSLLWLGWLGPAGVLGLVATGVIGVLR